MTTDVERSLAPILCILTQPETTLASIAAATLLSQRLRGPQVDLLHPRPDVDPDFMPTEEVMTADRLRTFEAHRDTIYRQLADLAASAHAGPVRQVRGQVREIVAAEAAKAWFVVAGAIGQHGHPEAKHSVVAALFDARAPLLLVPSSAPTVLGSSIAVAWERSKAADEAVQASLPLLLSADHVTILVAEERHVQADLPQGIVETLRQAGRAVSICHFGLAGRDIGDAILAEARTVGADLLVMGAFTHLRTLEALFGGATREVMAGADLPLLLHH